MSSVMRQDPWGVMPRLQDEINRLFGNARENDSSSATAVDGSGTARHSIFLIRSAGVPPQ